MNEKMLRSVVFLFLFSGAVYAQPYTTASIFAHNDYAAAKPFYNAYSHQVGFIEADIFLHQTRLAVAHTARELDPEKTLDVLYLKPLAEKIHANQGSVYPDRKQYPVLMIDLKTEGVATLNALVEKLKEFPVVTGCSTVQLVVSGNVPDTAQWKKYPMFILFDGRPGVKYQLPHLKRIAFISTNFSQYSSWKGEGSPSIDDIIRIKELRMDTHAKGKKLRFWGVPDVENAWRMLMKYQIDIIGTDRVNELVDFLEKQ